MQLTWSEWHMQQLGAEQISFSLQQIFNTPALKCMQTRSICLHAQLSRPFNWTTIFVVAQERNGFIDQSTSHLATSAGKFPPFQLL